MDVHRPFSFTKVYDCEGWWDLKLVATTPQIRAVAHACSQNLQRAISHADALVWTTWLAHVGGLLTAIQAKADRFDVSLMHPPSPDLDKQFREALSTLDTYNASDPEKSGEELLAFARSIIDNWLAEHNQVRPRLQVALGAILVGSWTAFESVCADLWEAALNTCPVPLAIAAINGQSDKSQRGEKGEALRFLENAIQDGEAIQAGTLLMRHSKFDFERFIRAFEIHTH